MYTLQVYYDGDISPAHIERLEHAADVLERIPELLREHDRCEKVVVMSESTRLFALDCRGVRLSD